MDIYGALILDLLASLAVTISTAKTPQVVFNSPAEIVLVQPKPQLNFDRDVIIPLQEAQAAAAKAEQDQINAELNRTRDRVQAPFTYANSYYFGNCTWYVGGRIPVPADWGNANNWFWAAQAAGWPTSYQPRIGAIATTTAGSWGHVAIVEAIDGGSVEVTEMNYNGFDIIDDRWAPASEFAYIY